MDKLAALIEEVFAEIQKQWMPTSSSSFSSSYSSSSPDSIKESVLSFVHAVDWTEPWLISLLAFHVIVLIAVIKTRKNNNVQTAIFFAALSCVYMAERLNIWLSRRWTLFARQPYFDHNGIFMSTVWSGPLLLISCIILVNGLLSLSSLIIKWKRAELKHRAQLTKRNEQKAD